MSRRLDPDWQWRALEPNLLALVADGIAWLVWSKTKDAKHNRKKPKPIDRPGVGRKKKNPEIVTADVDEVKRRLALPRKELEAA